MWAIIVTGAGRGFCSGGDTGRMGADTPPTPAEIKSGLWDLVQLISLKMTEIDKPIIAAVNGVAVGAGMDMSLHADLRIAAESARFADTYVRVGLVPGNGGAWFLPRIIGMPRALELHVRYLSDRRVRLRRASRPLAGHHSTAQGLVFRRRA